jgi:FliI/YscN family ATPase
MTAASGQDRLSAGIDLTAHRRRLADARLSRCVGSVLRVSGLCVESQGPPVGLGSLCRIRLCDGRSVAAEVVGFRESLRVLMPLEGLEGISPGDEVYSAAAPRQIRLGRETLGRVLDGLGRPIDGRGPLGGSDLRPIDCLAPEPMQRPRIDEPLEFGIRSIDGLLTCGKGQRVGIFAGSGVGKSTLLGEIARSSSADVNVLVLVGERGREVREFIEDCLGPEGLARSVLVVATADTSPVQRVRSTFLGLAIAEYFRDLGGDVLLMMDSVTRFAMAQREIGLAAGEPPTTKGYCPSVFGLLPKITERLGRTERGSITGMITVLVEGDDLADPIADTVRSLLDGHIVLSRRLAERGHYPAVDVLSSVSRLMTAVAAPEHQQAAQAVRSVWSTYHEAEDLINIGALADGANPRIDRSIQLIEAARELLVQPLGQRSDLQETVRRMQEISRAWNQPVQAPQAETAGVRE